ncbi:protein kinase domain-containing protein [Haliangium sp.]|uniref:nSTAND1 domain-containing NTPase n=1 Tax=Haliangium sp. TaxID=2663208 RepID=UPI003D0B8EF1
MTRTSPAADAPSFPPRSFDNFRLERALGQGGMGHVYLYTDVTLGREVAIKFLHHSDAHLRARFRREAKAAAQIDHPNVVRVYQFGEVEGEPYIVSEFVPGQHLGRLDTARRGWREVLALGVKLAAGLAAAHERGVLHRDIKPANVVVTEDGQPKLVDFGLARITAPTNADESEQRRATQPLPLLRRRPNGSDSDARADPAPLTTGASSSDSSIPTMDATMTQAGAIMGTPYFIAPEIYRGEAITPAADVYALGTLLYTLCTGREPFRDVPRHELAEAVRARPAPALAEVAPEVGPEFAAVIDRCLAPAPDDRPLSGRELFFALAALMPPERTSAPEGEPYPGMRPFAAEDADCFFGREADVRWVLERLRTHAVVVITGASGLGKSSLMRAGVLPRLTAHGLAAHGLVGEDDPARPWQTCTLIPGARPLTALSAALAPLTARTPDQVEEWLETSPTGLGRHLAQSLGDRAGLVIAIDQLEELVTAAAEPAQVAGFGRALAGLAARTPEVRVLATTRGGDLDALAQIPGLGPLLTRGLHWLEPLGRAQLREVVEQPARQRGVRFASAAMVTELLDDAGHDAGSLPLLQFALARLWAARDVDAGEIPEHALAGIGGMRGALARHADQVMESFVRADARREARRILVRLANLRETRVRMSRGALARGSAEAEEVIDALVEARLLVERRGEDEVTYELAHQALIQGWPRLADWLLEEDQALVVARRLSQSAALWDEQGRPPQALWRGRRLRAAGQLEVADLPPVEAAFARASRRADRRARWLQGGAAALAVVMAVAAYAGYRHLIGVEVDGLVQRARAPLTRAGEQVHEFLGLRGRSRERLAAITVTNVAEGVADGNGGGVAAGADDNPIKNQRDRAEAEWRQALTLVPAIERDLTDARRDLEQALLRDPGRDDVRTLLADVLEHQARMAEELDPPAALRALLDQLALHAPERTARWTQTGVVELRAVSAGPGPAAAEVAELRGVRVDVYEYEPTVEGTLRPSPRARDLDSPAQLSLGPGSYLAELHVPGHAAAIAYPFELAPGATLAGPTRIEVEVPAADAIPDGFVFVPAGRSWAGFGGDAMAERAREWELAPPPHRREIGSFSIARHETTFGDWLAFLRALPAEARRIRLPATSADDAIAVAVVEDEAGFSLRLRLPNRPPLTAGEGEAMVYDPGGRERRMTDWRRLPVTGVSGRDAEAYVSWLAETGRVPGARLCREDEWARAGRGADRRVYPHGDHLAPDEANIDVSYGRLSGASGPDPVGSHPVSRSPFGVDDMAGNATEMTVPVFDQGELVALRSSNFVGSARMNELVNRDFLPTDARNPLIGLRVCADLVRR